MTRTYQSLICAKNLSFIAQWHTFLADVLGKFHCAKSSTADHVGAGFLLSMRNQRRTSPPKQPAKDPKLHVQRNKPQKIWDSPFHTCKIHLCDLKGENKQPWACPAYIWVSNNESINRDFLNWKLGEQLPHATVQGYSWWRHCSQFCSFAHGFVYKVKHVRYELTPGS